MVFLQNAAYVASAMEVNIETKWQGFIKGFFSGESLFLIRCSGEGDLWFNTYGAMIEREINGEYVVDTGHIVAFTEGLDYGVEKVGGYKSLFFSGEGLVCRFRGQGKLWMQTRRAPALAMFMNPFRRTSHAFQLLDLTTAWRSKTWASALRRGAAGVARSWPHGCLPLPGKC